MSLRRRTIGLTLALAAGAVACSSSSGTGPTGGGGGGGGNSSTITASSVTTGGGAYGTGSGNYFFSPTPDTVAAGTAVTFTFGSVTHDVRFDTGPSLPDSIAPSTNTSVSRMFATAGTYNYHCAIHNFSGVLVVK